MRQFYHELFQEIGMSSDNRSTKEPGAHKAWWSSPTGLVLIGFVAIAGFLLAFEHRAHIFTGNWPLLLLLGACIVMHLFMHGGHGGRGGKHGGGED
jgi:uncharacterized membrane protein